MYMMQKCFMLYLYSIPPAASAYSSNPNKLKTNAQVTESWSWMEKSKSSQTADYNENIGLQRLTINHDEKHPRQYTVILAFTCLHSHIP
jgi:hypothetical protein